MTSQPVEANVVLSSDNSQYDRAMVTSAQSTDNLGMSVDSLGAKINNLSKTAGRTLIGISAADVAVITGATAAWASYEKQVSLLRAQSAILTSTQSKQTLVMKDYTTAVKGLRTAYGTTTAQAASLVQTLSKITAVQQSGGLKDLSKVFIDMSNATGESASGLASSLTDLQRIMGTPINTKQSRAYADQFTYLAAQTNSSAEGLINLTTQLAPIGKAFGLNQTQVTGFATAFAKAGQDGIAVSSVFTRVATDISKSLATGSPEIAHYANLLGLTNKQFKDMGPANEFVAVLEKLHTMGPKAAVELERLGLDGTRSLQSINAVLNQQGGAGGLRQTLGLAKAGLHSNAAAEGSSATDDLSRQFDKLREQLKMTAETFGNDFAPAVSAFVQGMTSAEKIINRIAEGPMGKFVALVMQLVAPLAGGAGAMLLFAGALMKVAAAFTVLRSSAAYGLKEGWQGSPGIVRGPNGFQASGSHTMLGTHGAQIAENGTFLQRAQYNTMQMAGGGLHGLFGGVSSGARSFRSFVDPQYQQAGPRGPLSYLAGGIGRAMDLAVTPLFDQMRYADPTKRTQYVQQLSPWARAADHIKLSQHMGEVGLAQTQLSTIQSAKEGVQQDALLSNQARSARMAELQAIEEETQIRLTTAKQAEQATTESIAATKIATKESGTLATGFRSMAEKAGFGPNAVGYRRLIQSTAGVGAGAVGGVIGGTTAGVGALAKSPLGGPMLGMATIAGASALGINSNAVNLGAMGMMMGGGPWGALAGAGIGAGIDIYKANQKVHDSISAINDAATSSQTSGTGLQDMYSSLGDTQKAMDLRNQQRGVGSVQWYNSPVTAFGSVRNWATGLTGTSTQEQDRKDFNAASLKVGQVAAAVTDLAKASGVKLTGTAVHQQKQLDTFMSTTGADELGNAGYTPAQLIAARKAMIAGGVAARDKYNTMIANSTTGGQEMIDRSSGTLTGNIMLGSGRADLAIKKQESVGILTSAVDDIFQTALGKGSNYQQILKSAEETQANIGTENTRQYELQAGVAAKAQQALQYQAPLMTAPQAFQSNIATQLSIQGGILSAPASLRTASQDAALQGSRTAVEDAFVQQAQTIKQALLMQDQFELSRSRAQDDYSLQVSYAEHDYQLQRSRAEESYHRSRTRETADYYRSVNRQQYAFDLQRQRSQADFSHSVEVQAKQTAMSAMDVYHRVPTQRTGSASWLLSNAGDQLARLRQMEKDLNKLRELGFSDNVIQQLRLTDPNNAQQLTRFVAEVQDRPGMVSRFNKAMGARVGAAKNISTDQSSLDWKETQRAFNLQRSRSEQDFTRQMAYTRTDFNIGLDRQKTDFGIMMGQQATDFSTMMGRQEDAYHKTMSRAAEDLALIGKDMSGTLESIFTKGAESLTGNMQKQAKAALSTLNELSRSTKLPAIALMKELAAIFGFKYHVPAAAQGHMGTGAPEQSPDDTNPNKPGVQLADGGIVPGWTPGRDTKMVPLSGGEAIMRPEWARAVGQETIAQMNHQAKHGGFAGGGIYRPIAAAPSSRGVHDQWTHYAALDFPAPVGTPAYAVASGHISQSYDIAGPLASDTYHNPAYGPYGSYGRVMYLKTDIGPELIYAHLSKRGFARGAHVHGGEAIAASGSTGNSSGPHLHFGDSDGNPMEFVTGMLGHGAIHGSVAGGTHASTPTVRQLSSVLHRRYPDAEKAAWAMQGVHPLNPGDISHVINKMATDRYRQALQGHHPSSWHADGGVFNGAQQIGIGENGPEAVIPLNDQGANFLAMALHGAEARGIGMRSTPSGGGMSIYNTRIDKSTNFTGAITVQANDPNELLNKLQARQRVMALSRPSLTGSAA